MTTVKYPRPPLPMGERAGRSQLAERNMLIVMKLHLDGSEGDDDEGRKWMTLAGYIASDGFWRDFDDRWTTMLHNRYPIAPYIHMNELMGWDDPFERVNGWTDIVLDTSQRMLTAAPLTSQDLTAAQ